MERLWNVGLGFGVPIRNRILRTLNFAMIKLNLWLPSIIPVQTTPKWILEDCKSSVGVALISSPPT